MARKASNGLTVERLGELAYHAFYNAMGSPRPWDQVPDELPWYNVAACAIEHLDMHPDDDTEREVHCPTLARQLYDAMCAGEDGCEYNAINKDMQVAWNAVGRHLVNCIAIDKEDVSITDFHTMGAYWTEWAQQKLQKEEV